MIATVKTFRGIRDRGISMEMWSGAEFKIGSRSLLEIHPLWREPASYRQPRIFGRGTAEATGRAHPEVW